LYISAEFEIGHWLLRQYAAKQWIEPNF